MAAPKVHELLSPTDWGPLYWEANGFTPQQASAMFDFASAVIGEINLWHMSIEIIGDRRYVTLGVLPDEEVAPEVPDMGAMVPEIPEVI
jgi:hypothetical protein